MRDGSAFVTQALDKVTFTLADGAFHYRVESDNFTGGVSYVECRNADTDELLSRGVASTSGPTILDGWAYVTLGATLNLIFRQFYFYTTSNGRETLPQADYVVRTVSFQRYLPL